MPNACKACAGATARIRSRPVLHGCCSAAPTACANICAPIADGTYSFEDFIGHDFVNPERSYTVKLTMEKSADRLKVNFDGTSAQADGPINFAATPKFYAKLLGSAFKPHIPDLVLNEGVSEVFELEAPPEGSLLNPRFPAPVATGQSAWCACSDTFQG